MKKYLYLIVLMSCFSCQQASKEVEQHTAVMHQEHYWRHLEYLLQLKKEVAQTTWSGFAKQKFFQPAIYYTHEGTFVLNPNAHILSMTEHEKMKPFGEVERIKLSEAYTDTANFNFHTSYSETDSTALYYQENVLFFQSFDLTKQLIGVTDLQDWSIMVSHELFHGYQRSIPAFKAYYTQVEIPGGPDEFLAKYHKELEWYKESIHRENELLKAIWLHDADVLANLNAYDSLRMIRIQRIRDEYGVDILEAEDYELLIEGHTRYFESLCKRHIAQQQPDTSMLQAADVNLISKMFEGYEVKKDKGLYNLYNDRYYYPLGYNISMILEKYLPTYKQSIYLKEHNFNRYLEMLRNQQTK